MTQGFSVTVSEGAPHVMKLAGELDMSNASDLQAALELLRGSVVVDCTTLDFIDSTGISVLVAAHQALADHGEQLTLRGLSGLTRRVFEISGLGSYFELEGDGDSDGSQGTTC